MLAFPLETSVNILDLLDVLERNKCCLVCRSGWIAPFIYFYNMVFNDEYVSVGWLEAERVL